MEDTTKYCQVGSTCHSSEQENGQYGIPFTPIPFLTLYQQPRYLGVTIDGGEIKNTQHITKTLDLVSNHPRLIWSFWCQNTVPQCGSVANTQTYKPSHIHTPSQTHTLNLLRRDISGTIRSSVIYQAQLDPIPQSGYLLSAT